MPDPTNPISRRSLLTVGAAAFTIVQPHLVRGAGKEKLRAGVVGCGGRGTQATIDLLTGNENVELVAMADVFEDHLEGAHMDGGMQIQERLLPASGTPCPGKTPWQNGACVGPWINNNNEFCRHPFS